FALLIWLHVPLWRYFADLIRSLAEDSHRRIVIAAIGAVSAAYLIMFAIVFDYSRWISNWAVCLFLILHAVKALPTSQAVPSIPGNDRKTVLNQFSRSSVCSRGRRSLRSPARFSIAGSARRARPRRRGRYGLPQSRPPARGIRAGSAIAAPAGAAPRARIRPPFCLCR